MEAARIVHESIIKLQTDLNIKIDIESISYARLMNHIKFLIIRLNTNEQLQMDISEFTKDKFPFAYEQAIRMCDNLSKNYQNQKLVILLYIWKEFYQVHFKIRGHSFFYLLINCDCFILYFILFIIFCMIKNNERTSKCKKMIDAYIFWC